MNETTPTTPSFDLMTFIADESVQYLPRLNSVTGSKEATILLLRVIKWWEWAKRRGRTSFYKFTAPCAHPDCASGDTWQEELGFSRTEFETAIAKIGTRIKTSESKDAVMASNETSAAVLYFTNAKRVTFYHVNERVVLAIFAKSYSQNLHQSIAGILHQSIAENLHQSNAGNLHYLSLQRDNDHKKEPKDTTRQSASQPNVKKKKRTPKDERTKHPAICLLRGILGHWPAKVYWDDIIALADPEGKGINKLDPAKIKGVLQVFTSVGGFQNNLLLWLFDWYVNGIPFSFRGARLEGTIADRYRRQAIGQVGNDTTDQFSRGGNATSGRTDTQQPQLRRAKNQ